MYSGSEVIVFCAVAFVFGSFISFIIGYEIGEGSYRKKQEAEKRQAEQLKMWNDYLSAVRGGQHGR